MMLGTKVRLVWSRWWPGYETRVIAVQESAPGRVETVDVTIPDGRVARYHIEDVEIIDTTQRHSEEP